MSYFVGSITHSTTGVKSVTVGFQPVGMRITVGQKDGSTDTTARDAYGVTDGTTSLYRSLFRDGTGGQTVSGNGKLISVLDRVSGTVTEVIKVTFDSFTATQVKYNVVTANVNYTLNIEAWD